MGKLIELHLNNFKSWAGQHVLHFGDSYFTSVIGPNGSGKSNTMDAISFVLGMRALKLRSSHARDLIYRGRVLKHSKLDLNGATNGGAENDESRNSDEEESERAVDRKDPQSASVMLVYEDDEGQEHRWKRTITMSNAVEYRMNNKVVTAKVYNEALEAENILIKARNFLVFQGDVETVASQQPKDLTRLLEEISGSLEYKEEYERLRLDKERAEELQSRRLQDRRGVNGEIRALKEEKDVLDQFEQKQDEREAAVVTHILWKLHHFQRTIEDSAAEIQKHHDELKEYRRNVKKHETQLEQARKAQTKASQDVGKVQKEVKKRQRSAAEKEQDLLPINEKLGLSKPRLDQLVKARDGIASKRDEKVASIKKLEKDRAIVEKAQQRWQQEWNAQQQKTGQALSKQDLVDCERLRNDVSKQVGESQMKATNLRAQLRSDEDSLAVLRSSIESMQSNVEGLQTESQAIKDQRNNLSSQSVELESKLKTKQITLNELNSERTRAHQRQQEIDEKLHQTLVKLSEATADQRESRKDQKSRDNVTAMKRLFPGVKGMVWQLCKPVQKKYDTALPIILGRQWDSVIVDSEKTASACIQYLKDQRGGQTEFLPLDTIVHTQPNAASRSMHQGARLAIDCIEFSPALERAMSSVCGNDMIADTWEIARDLKWNRKVDAKIVTLDGRCITKADLISGGAGPGDRKRHFEDAEVDALRKLVEKLKAQMTALPNDSKAQMQETEMKREIDSMRAKQKLIDEEITALDRNLKSKSTELDHAKKELAKAQSKFKEQDKAVKALQKQRDALTAEISKVEDRVFQAFCKRLGFSDIREYERQQGGLEAEARAKKRDFDNQLTRLDNRLSLDRDTAKSFDTRLRTVETQAKREQDLISTLEAQKEEIGSELDQLNAEMEHLNEKLGGLEEESDARAAAVTEARKAMEKRTKAVSTALSAVASLDLEVDKAVSDRYMELRRCKIENIDIPLESDSGDLDSLPMEVALPEIDDTAMEIDGEEAIRITKANDYGIRPDFSRLTTDQTLDNSGNMEAQLQAAIETLQSEIDKMAPNMRSGERLDATSARLRGVNQDWNDAQKSAFQATKAFEAIKKKRMDLFNKAFAHIRTHIEPVYRDLTKSLSWPMGGKAYLDVEDDEEPYLMGVKYHVTPPGKRFRDMEHLSGGEKTMAALALLFAVHTYAPSPFFVLDEVDAALDVANTTKLANYVKEHAGPGMQFVVISLKTGLFQNSETLVGVMRDQTQNSSKALMLDLRQYRPVAQAV